MDASPRLPVTGTVTCDDPSVLPRLAPPTEALAALALGISSPDLVHLLGPLPPDEASSAPSTTSMLVQVMAPSHRAPPPSSGWERLYPVVASWPPAQTASTMPLPPASKAMLVAPPAQQFPVAPPAPQLPMAPPAQLAPGAPPAQQFFVAPPAPQLPMAPPAQLAPGAPPAQQLFAAPPAPQLPMAPPAQLAPGAPPAQQLFAAPPAPQLPMAPPAQPAPGAPPAQQLFAAPPALQLPMAPPAQLAPGAPSAQQFPVAPPAPQLPIFEQATEADSATMTLPWNQPAAPTLGFLSPGVTLGYGQYQDRSPHRMSVVSPSELPSQLILSAFGPVENGAQSSLALHPLSLQSSQRPYPAASATWTMDCLPEQWFSTPEEAQDALNRFAWGRGYAVVYKSTSYDCMRQKRLIQYGCDRHGKRRTHNVLARERRRPNAGSRRCGCTMAVFVVRKALSCGKVVWELQHRGRAFMHNHPPSASVASHPILRRAVRTDAVRLAIKVDGETGTKATQTIARLLLEDPNLVVTPRDVYNERHRSFIAELGGLTRLEYLVQKLQNGPFEVAYKLDGCRRLTHLFFAHKSAATIYSENFDVVLLDCTYRTNRFNMPLLNIVGVTGMNTTIHIAQVFMVGETAPDYEWALQQLVQLQSKFGIPLPQVFLVDRDLALLNALETIYPRVPVLLCIWHIMKDVQAHARRRTFMREIDPETNQLRDSAAHEAFCEAFVRLINAPTEDEFNFRRRELYLLSSEEAAYIDDVWLDIWKRRIVRCWTDSIVHFGMHATSRVEGYHATMKAWLGSSRGDFLTVHNRMEHWWRQTINKHQKLVSDAEIVLPTRLQASFYADVAKVIHAHALTKCYSAYRRIDVLMRPCTGSYSRTMGIPCTHQLHIIADSGLTLQPNHFHPHWWIHRSQAPPTTSARIVDPERIRDRRAQRASQRRNQHVAGNGPRGTRRIPSTFELM